MSNSFTDNELNFLHCLTDLSKKYGVLLSGEVHLSPLDDRDGHYGAGAGREEIDWVEA